MSIWQYVVTLPVVIWLHYFPPDPRLNTLPLPDGTTEVNDIAYADGPRHMLDVYRPRPTAMPAPVVVFIYGGGWIVGEKAWYRFVASALVASGMLVVIPDYRLYPEVRFPAFMDDAAAAVAWTRTNAGRFGGDPRRLFLMGHSAGATIAALLALDPSYLRAAGLSTRDVCGVIGLAGPYDFLPLAGANMITVFGQVAELPRTQPINYVNHDAPPMLLTAGTWDNSVDPANTSRMASKLRSVGASVTAPLYPGITHTALLDSITTQYSFISPTREDTLRFVAEHGACGDPANGPHER
jgi:acetyl esterase/lipase